MDRPLRIQQSEPVEANGASFTLVAETEWRLKRGRRARKLEIQLHIKNVGNADALFHTFDTYGLGLRDSDGKDIRAIWRRDITTLTPPVLIVPGESFDICPKAELEWDEEAKACRLSYRDATQCTAVYGPLTPGRYTVAFEYASAANRRLKMIAPDCASPVWIGSATTGEITIELPEH